MKFPARLFLLVCCAFTLGAPSFAARAAADAHESSRAAKGGKTPARLLEKFLIDFDLPGAGQQAETRLRRDPADITALFVRMETAELEERPEAVLDSALRLCSLSAEGRLQ